jgi:hypothetical protein
VTALRTEPRPDGAAAIFLTAGDDPAAGRVTVAPRPPDHNDDKDGAGERRGAGGSPDSYSLNPTAAKIEALFSQARTKPIVTLNNSTL